MNKKTLLKLSPLFLALAAAMPAQANDDTIVVTASGFNQKIQNAAASISVVSRTDLEKKAYNDVTDALKDMPGVTVTGGGSTSDISLRGMSSKYTLILVNGKRVTSRETRPNSDGSGIEQGWLPPLESIERIEVVRGPMSSLYGSDAMGGVINIITRKNNNKDGWHGSISTQMTYQEHRHSGDIFQTNLYAAGSIIDGYLGARVNGLLSRRGEDKILNGYNEQKMRSGSVALNFTPTDSDEFEFEYSRSLQDRDSMPGMSSAETDRNGDPNTPSYSRYERSSYTLSHSGNYDLGSTNTYLTFSDNNNPSRDMRLKETTFNTQGQLLLDSHALTLGGQYRYESLSDSNNQLTGDNPQSKLTRWSWALFAEDEWAMTESFSLTGGLRMEDDQNYGLHWTPRLYGVWALASNWTLKGGVSTGYRSPDLRQVSKGWGQSTGGRGGHSIILGNPDLKAEKSISEEVALLWDNQQGITAGITLFNTDYRDKITEVRKCESDDRSCVEPGIDDKFDFISERENVDKARLFGVELDAAWQITEDWHVMANYTYNHSEQLSGTFKGKPLNQIPYHMFNTTIDWQVSDDVDVWTRYNLRSKTSEYSSRASMSKGTPSYGFVDLGLNYQANKAFKVSAGVYNLLDKKVGYETHKTVLDGRRYTVSATYSF